MATTVTAFESGHEDMIHDVQADYYGKRLATCSSDRMIRLFSIEGEGQRKLLAELKGHDGPVWQVAWAHPKFDSLLASCGYDRKVIVWKEVNPDEWVSIYEYCNHESSVNSIAWAPHDCGLMLACASSDGCVSVITHQQNDTWEPQKFHAHNMGCNAVSWAPSTSPGSILTSGQGGAHLVRKFASGGCDNVVKIWTYNESEKVWRNEDTIGDGHTDWVRDVAWAPSIGLPSNTIASCSQDRTVIIWTQEEAKGSWSRAAILPKFPAVVWRVSWSITGNVLAVSSGDNKVSLWKETHDGEWKVLDNISPVA